MLPGHQQCEGEAPSAESVDGDPFTTGEVMLARAKSVARRIAEKVRELTGDIAQTPGEDEPPLT
jgi:hypothetical protein